MAGGGCTRCGKLQMLQVNHTHVGGEVMEVRLCVWCRRLGAQETEAARARSQGKEGDA